MKGYIAFIKKEFVENLKNLSPLTHGSSFIKIFLGSDSAH